MNHRPLLLALALLAAPLTLPAQAAPILLQPDETASQDVMAYQFFGTTNWENAFGGAYRVYLAAGATGTGHDQRSVLRFDLTGVTLDPGEHAFLRLYSMDASLTGFGATVSSSTPAATDFYVATTPWDEGTVTWNTLPATDATPAVSAIVDHIGWIEVDVTPVVQSWLDGSRPNYGLLLQQPGVVLNGGQKVSVVYSSASGGNAPTLAIVAAPEPASLALLTLGTAALLRRRR